VENKPPEECGKYAAATGALNAAAFGPMEGRINPESVSELIKAQAHL
jgi:sugar/nucleoside kinase (ribokinase family)